ncbi:thermonuclease family protein [Myxosarcina sp. GI1]|uniref:thermonuclease family protein n=1 Tax=Myxosarcina sp. GI1 TaxID=1541065 RepID=UPI000564F5DC|nr:thermonuclease family protein [Myxosarcina sp. GI1]
MKFKTFANAIALFIGLGLAAYSQLDKTSEPTTVEDGQKFEEWQLKPGSIYDGDTLRVVRGNEELKIRFCGIDAPEKKQKLGIESRDHLRSLVERSNGKLLLVPIEQDRYGRTVAEVYAHDRRSSAINLNLQMVRDGYAWHYEKYSANCPTGNDYAIAERLAREEKLGVWNGNHQAPWEWRKANK